jgi:S-adenosylmethionine hydrolase
VAVFSDVAEQTLAAIVDSQGFLALVVNRGSASANLDLRPGATVVLEAG